MPSFSQIAFSGSPSAGQTSTVIVNGSSFSYTAKVGDALANIVAALSQAISAALSAAQPARATEPYSCSAPSATALRVVSINPNFVPSLSASSTDSGLTLTATSG